MMSKSENSKNRILMAARKVFAEKGYDGARVDEIASEAGINKAMLYYYFGSKDNILREIITNMSLTYKTEEHSRFNINNLINENGMISDDSVESSIDEGLKSIKDNENLFRIILTEAFKAATSDIVGVNVFDHILTRVIKDVHSLGIEVEDEDEFKIKQFFFIVMPMLTFIALRDDWSKYYDINSEELDRIFKKALKQYNKLGVYPG